MSKTAKNQFFKEKLVIETILKIMFFSALGGFALLWLEIFLRIKRCVEKGDVSGAYWGAKSIIFLPQKVVDRIALKALKVSERELAIERRRVVVALLRKIPDIHIVETGLGEE